MKVKGNYIITFLIKNYLKYFLISHLAIALDSVCVSNMNFGKNTFYSSLATLAFSYALIPYKYKV